MSKETLEFVTPPPPKNDKISSAFSYNFNSALTEKISHPPKTLTTEGMPDTFDPDVGDLCLYAPWGNLCIFYRDFRNSTSLIPLGHIDSGMDVIGGMTEDFTITMEAVK